jgi:hypothetical protein
MKKIIAFATFAILTTSSYAFSLSDIRLWAGSGTNEAGLVIDFNDNGNRRSFAWGYRWNGTATGEDLIRAVDSLDNQLSATIFGSSLGAYVDSMTYKTYTGGSWPSGYFSYWTGSPSSWTYSSVGMSTRALSNGDWDGWSYVVNGQSDSAPTVPVAAVPEPATLLALAAGFCLSYRRRR